MEGDKAKSPTDREAEAAQRALFESAMFQLGSNPFAMAAQDPTGAYAQLAAAQMQAYSAMMARHPAFAANPYGGLGMFGEGLGSPMHSPMGPAFMPGAAEWWHAATSSEHARQMASTSGYDYFASSLNSLATAFSTGGGVGMTPDALNLEALLRDPNAAQKSFGLYGNPFMMPPYSSMVTTTTTSSSSHSSPLKANSAKTMVTSTSTATRSSPASTASRSSDQSSSFSKYSNRHEMNESSSTAPPPAHTSVIKSPQKMSGSEEHTRDSDDDFLAKEVLNHLKNQQAQFMRREQELKLQHTAESNQGSSIPMTTEAQRELAAEMMRKRQHEQLVNQLKSSQYDAMPNLKKFAEQQLQKQKNKGKDSEHEYESELYKKHTTESHERSAKSPSDHHDISKEQQEYLNKKKLADQIRERVQKKADGSASSSMKESGKIRDRPKTSKTLLNIPHRGAVPSDDQKRKDDLREKLEAELKQQQLQLKMAKKAQAQHSKQSDDKSKSKDSSRLAQALLGKTGSPPPAMQVETSADRPLVATFKTLNTAVAAETNEDDSGSSSDSCSSDSDDSGSSSDSDSSSNSESIDPGTPGTPAKRKSTDEVDSSGTDGSMPPKKMKEINEEELRIPLEHGWRRETRIRTVGQRGIVGDVVYYAPCGKILKSLQEISKYLSTNNITDLTRENYDFSTRVSVGDFLELSNDGNNGMVSLSEQEVQTLLNAALQRRPAQRRAVKRTQQKKKEAAKIAAQEKIAKKIEQQEIAKFAMEQRLKKKMEREMKKRDKMRLKQMKGSSVFGVTAEDRQKQKERFKLLRQREKQQRLEDMRMEREVRAQQLLEAKKRKKEEQQNQRFAEAMKKAKDREMKRQQAMMIKEQERERRKHMLIMVGLERERRRQHLILLKALETRKKIEERERLREEKTRERVMIREKKMEQRRMEIQMAYEMKRPVDDLRIKDCKALPNLDRIPGVKLPGQPFADTLMVFEFLHNFGEALEFDDDSIPSLNTLQLGILNDEDHIEDVMTLLAQLLKLAIDDPGVPNPKEAMTKLNQKIADVDISDDNVSEVLRIFMEARNGKPDELSTELHTIPFQALNTTSKASCLAFLCNELLGSSTVVGEIEEGLENISNLRKDKWVVEGKLRKLKATHAKKSNRPAFPKPLCVVSEDSNSVMTNLSSKHGSDDEDEESGHESGAELGEAAVSDGEEDSSISMEDLEKKIEKLSKQQGQFRSKVIDASRKLRAVDFGVDRYKRRYWVLPHSGGLFVEGIESGDVEEFFTLNPESEVENQNSLKEYENEKKEIKSEKNDGAEKEDKSVPMETGAVGDVKTLVSGEEKCNDKSETKPLVNGDVLPSDKVEDIICKTETKENDICKNGEDSGKMETDITEDCKSSPVIEDKKPVVSKLVPCDDQISAEKDKVKCEAIVKTDSDDVKPTVNGFDAHDNHKDNKCNQEAATDFKIPSTSKDNSVIKSCVEVDQDMNPSKSETPKSSCSSAAGTPDFKKHLNMSLDSLHGNSTMDSIHGNSTMDSLYSSKMDTSSEASFMSPYQYMTGMKSSISDTHWFTILPKIACDEQSITNASSGDKQKSDMAAAAAAASGMSPYGYSGQMFSPLQMSQLHGSPYGYGMMPMTSSPYFYQGREGHLRAPSESSMDCSNMAPPENLHQVPQPIPSEMQKGWWRITDPNQLKTVLRCLLSRGYREKHLQRNFQKNMDFAIQHCGKGSQEVLELDITDQDREVSQNACSAPSPDKRGSWNTELAHTLERSVLEDVESLEERIFNASLQVKGWKMPTKATEDESIVLISKHQKKTEDNMQFIMDVARTRLAELEQNIERRYLKPPLNKMSEILTNNTSASSSRSSPTIDTDVPKGLLAWRQAVTMAISPSQLSLCMVQLNGAISWEKSVMKVLCQICRLDDNEAELLLCDSCDKGYHTYCFKPAMTDIPDGDWFCYECVSRANKVSHCIRCGKKNGRMAICNNCPVAFHIDCIDPPFQRTPRKWICGSCTGCKSKYTYQRARYSKARKKQLSESIEDENSSSNVGSDACPTPEKKSRTKSESMKSEKCDSPAQSETTANDWSTDFSFCWSALADLEKHPDSKPFHNPVNCKKFPSYRKFIKKPMDFSTVRKNLNNSVYKATNEFADDIRQIFDNCEVFNEDDSEVGITGHTLRKMFEDRWTEFTGGV